MTTPPSVRPDHAPWFALDLTPPTDVSAEAFVALCRANPALRFERDAAGAIVVMPPAGPATSHRNSVLTAAVQSWASRDGTGVAFDSSGGFVLPSGAVRSPDVAWVRRERLKDLTQRDADGFAPLCPDFVIELRSAGDRLADLRAKMAEYIEGGARLGWLVDPQSRTVTVFRPGEAPRTLVHPERVHGEPDLPGLTIELGDNWEVGF